MTKLLWFWFLFLVFLWCFKLNQSDQELSLTMTPPSTKLVNQIPNKQRADTDTHGSTLPIDKTQELRSSESMRT